MDVSSPLTLCSSHTYLMSVRWQALCFPNHRGRYVNLPSTSKWSFWRIRCISRQLLLGLEGAQEIAPFLLAGLGTRRLREGPRCPVDSGEWGMDLSVHSTCYFFSQQGAVVPSCSHWQPKELWFCERLEWGRKLPHRGWAEGQHEARLERVGRIPVWNLLHMEA